MKTVSHLALFNIEDLMILIVDPSTWSMDGVIMKCACETVTDAKTQMIVRCAEADASTQCLVNFSS